MAYPGMHVCGTHGGNSATMQQNLQEAVREWRRSFVHRWADGLGEHDKMVVADKKAMRWLEEAMFLRSRARAGDIADDVGRPISRSALADLPWEAWPWQHKLAARGDGLRRSLAKVYDTERGPILGRRWYGAEAWVWTTRDGKTMRRRVRRLW
jgi:hypothetical protein